MSAKKPVPPRREGTLALSRETSKANPGKIVYYNAHERLFGYLKANLMF
jgi:hypothetical protein